MRKIGGVVIAGLLAAVPAGAETEAIDLEPLVGLPGHAIVEWSGDEITDVVVLIPVRGGVYVEPLGILPGSGPSREDVARGHREFALRRDRRTPVEPIVGERGPDCVRLALYAERQCLRLRFYRYLRGLPEPDCTPIINC